MGWVVVLLQLCLLSSSSSRERDYGLFFADMMSKLTCLHSLLAGKDNIVCLLDSL
jgi:hypothetical protein